MKKYIKTIDEIIDAIEYGDTSCPFPIDVIPNEMGINLSSVHSIEWYKTESGQLIDITIHFKPIY